MIVLQALQTVLEESNPGDRTGPEPLPRRTHSLCTPARQSASQVLLPQAHRPTVT